MDGESGSSGRVACSGGVDLMLQFWLKRGDDGTKCCQNMNQTLRAHLNSIERKCDMVRRRDDVRRRGGTKEGK
jgi:hypothetical protein